MRKLSAVVPIIAGTVGLGLLVFASPAIAAPTGGTPVTIEVGGGGLNISVPSASVDLGAVAVSASAQPVSAKLGMVTVTDNRGGTAGWTATASAIDFTSPSYISVSAPGSSSYTTPLASVTGTATVAASNMTPLYPPAAVQVATGVIGINAASWNPTIMVTMPANALAGTYTSTITHSVS